MNLFNQYNFIRYIANKDYGGNMYTPDQHALNVKYANMECFKIKMGLPEDFQPGAPITRQSFDISKRMNADTNFLNQYESAEAVAGGYFAKLSGYFCINDMRYGYQRTVDGSSKTIWKPVEELTEAEFTDRMGNYTKEPTYVDPVCVQRGSNIYVYPSGIVQVQFVWVKYPTEPVFNYTQQTGYIEAASSTEFEWPQHVIDVDITLILLKYIGINLREDQLLQYAQQHKAQGA